MRPLWAMIVANMKMTVRNRTALFWMLAFPIIFIVLFGFLLGGSDFSVNVGVVNATESPLTAQVVDQMKSVDSFKVSTGDRDAEMNALNKGDRDVVVIFGPGQGGSQASAEIWYDQANAQTSQVAVSAIQQFFSEANQAMSDAPRPIVATVQGVSTQSMSYIDFLVPGILAMSIMTSGMIGLSSYFVTYREKGILRRIKATPFPLSSFIVARILTSVVLAVAQAVILLGIGKLLFDVNIGDQIASLVVLVVLGSAAFLGLGFLISGVARNTEAADGIANAVSFPMMFLGGVFFPVDAAPAWMQPITKVIPLTYFANGLRDVMLNGATLVNVWLDVAVLVGTAAVAVVLAVRFFRWEAQTA